MAREMTDLEFLERTKEVYDSLATNARHCFNVPMEDLNLGAIELERRLAIAKARFDAIQSIISDSFLIHGDRCPSGCGCEAEVVKTLTALGVSPDEYKLPRY